MLLPPIWGLDPLLDSHLPIGVFTPYLEAFLLVSLGFASHLEFFLPYKCLPPILGIALLLGSCPLLRFLPSIWALALHLRSSPPLRVLSPIWGLALYLESCLLKIDRYSLYSFSILVFNALLNKK